MATQPDNTRQHQAEAAALLLGIRYNLPALIRQQGIKPRPFRRIEPTEALRSGVAAPYFDIVRAWRAERDPLLTTYTAALPARGRTPSADASQSVQRHVDMSAAKIAATVMVAGRLTAAMGHVDRWHRLQWIARVKAATGLDVAMFTGAHDGAATVRNAVVRAEQLAGAIHTEIQGKVGTTLINSLSARVPASALAGGLNGTLDGARARAARIGVDQANKLSAELDRVRRHAAGLGRFTWRHSNAQKHPRPAHVTRDGRTYTEATAPNDRAGMLPFCACWEEPEWD